jgi:hypothetical protein
MRNPIMGIAIAIVFAASSQSALAGSKYATKGTNIPAISLGQYRKAGGDSNSPTTTINPALKGSALEKGGAGSPQPRGYDLKANKGR